MSLRDVLSAVVARDARFDWRAYLFTLEALEFTKSRKPRKPRSPRTRARTTRPPSAPQTRHVTGRELCEGARLLALEQFGLLAPMVLARWGIHSTSDLGEIVYNLIAAGALEKTPTDARTDFDEVFDFATDFSRDYDWTSSDNR